MNNFFRALIAGAAAKKFGGGCLGTIVIFGIVWVLLGQCSNSSPIRENSAPEIEKKQLSTQLVQPASVYPSVVLRAF